MRIRPTRRPSAARSANGPPMPTFSADDLIAALRAAQREAPARRGLTSGELVAATGMPRRRILDQLRLLKDAGRLLAEQELRPGLDDKPRPTSVYRVKA